MCDLRSQAYGAVGPDASVAVTVDASGTGTSFGTDNRCSVARELA
jgi:hypothetical protein